MFLSGERKDFLAYVHISLWNNYKSSVGAPFLSLKL